MIKVLRNENFPRYIQVYAFGIMIEEFENKRKALKRAQKLARKAGQGFFLYLDEFVES